MLEGKKEKRSISIIKEFTEAKKEAAEGSELDDSTRKGEGLYLFVLYMYYIIKGG